jgi:hypothetical protein
MLYGPFYNFCWTIVLWAFVQYGARGNPHVIEG